MALLDRYINARIERALETRRHGPRIVGSFVHPNIDTLADVEQLAAMERAKWPAAWRGIATAGVPVAGIGGFPQVIPAPGNSEPQTAPAAVTGVTVETNLYTPATTSGNDFALIPQ